ncbi:unnamed protein product, partial [Symbiodinium microadriaticum]
ASRPGRFILLLELARRRSHEKKNKQRKRQKDHDGAFQRRLLVTAHQFQHSACSIRGRRKEQDNCDCRDREQSEAHKEKERKSEGRKRKSRLQYRRRSRHRAEEAANVAFHFAGVAKAHRSNPKQAKGWFHWIPAMMGLHFDPSTNTAFNPPREMHMLDFGRERLTFSVADTSIVVKLCLRDQANEKLWANQLPELVAEVYWTGQVTVRLSTTHGLEELTLYGLWQRRVETAKEWVENSSPQMQKSFMTYTCAVLTFLALQGIQLRDTGRSNLGLVPGTKESGVPRLIFYDALDWSREKRQDFRWSQYWNYAKAIVPNVVESLRFQVSEARRDPAKAAKEFTDRCQEYAGHLEDAGVLRQGAFAVVPSWLAKSCPCKASCKHVIEISKLKTARKFASLVLKFVSFILKLFLWSAVFPCSVQRLFEFRSCLFHFLCL